ETNFNPEEAIAELGEMAKLSFRDPDGNILIEGKNIISAEAVQNTAGISTQYAVELTFDTKGAALFEKATGDLIGKQMGIYMDEELISNPVVNAKISGGKGIIDNMASYKEAKVLADKINAGALPFSLKTTNFSTISPTLGNQALHIMVIAGGIAFVLICLFMITVYKLPGIIACLTLVLQMSLQLLSVSVPQYTLTLTGIAGIVLSVGMAVDTNIIISERIADEIKKGLTVRAAVRNGYKNAFSSVFDGNFTTAIVAVILMIFGSGSMLSFGYTLLMGMIFNLLVGVSVSKHLLLGILEFPKFNKEKYFARKKETKLRLFYESKKKFALLSGALLIFGIVSCFVNGVKLDTQFTGGVVLNYTVAGEVDTNAAKNAVSTVTDRPVTVQISSDRQSDEKQVVITLAGNGGISPEVQNAITEALNTTCNATLAQTYAVEPYIGAKALKNSGIAIILSFVFIVIYVWIRFSTIHGLSAGVTGMLALLHDVLIVFFTFVVFKIPLNDSFVAVTLTIIGYSINDTIVVYDRIRENEKSNPRIGRISLVNESISQTLRRSVNTSLTTGLCVLIILIASYIFHITSITEFALPMFFGVICGCYSSVCIASIIWCMWELRKQKKVRQ
ncbi:protein translocase subunit SecF, partial [Anaerosporobacter sp.]|uniref:protein translocase subunit SecF n=1 Tax=Anaerosporobacter sp. TaxID=1872529 RepID=UPI00286F01AA